MRTFVTLFSGILVTIAVFLKWLGVGEDMAMYPGLTATGWGVIGGAVEWVNITAPIFVLTGGILMVLCSIAALILPSITTMSRGALTVFGIIARITALLALLGAFWYIVDVISIPGVETHSFGIIGYGVFIALVTAAVGLALGGVNIGTVLREEKIPGALGRDLKTSRRVATFSAKEYIESRESAPAKAAPGTTVGFREEAPEKGPVSDAPRASREHFERASQLEALGQYDKALAEYSQAIANDSRYTLAYFNRGSLLMMQGKKADATVDFKKVIELADNPDLSRMAESRISQMQK